MVSKEVDKNIEVNISQIISYSAKKVECIFLIIQY